MSLEPVSVPDPLTEPVSAHEPHRFVALDALRGAAALAVVGFHISISACPHGYLAVDFFFLLSGFVVTFAYQDKLDLGKISSFAQARTIRLYPLYLLGLLLGAVLGLIKHGLHFPSFSLKSISIAAILGLFLIPQPHMVGAPSELFPLNPPAWSLFNEGVSNAYHALFFRRRGLAALGVIIGMSLVALVYAALTHEDFDFGYEPSSLFLGIARCIYSYSVGMCLCVLWKKGKPSRGMPFLLILLLLAGSFLMPQFRHGNAFYDLLTIVAVNPVLLWFSIKTTMSGALQPLFKIFAEASYAIYILNMPLLGILSLAWNRLSHHRAPPVWVEVAFVIAITGTAIAADYFYDRPIRQKLGRLPRS